MALALNAVASITLVAVGVVGIKYVVSIAPFLGAFVEFINLSVFEMGTISAYRWIPLSRVGLRPWGACRRPSVRWSPHPSFRRRRGAGWRRCTLLLGFHSVAVLAYIACHSDGERMDRTGVIAVDQLL